MNYMVLRNGDETTTRLIKRPPFSIPSFDEVFKGRSPRSADGAAAHQVAVSRLAGNFAMYEEAERMGVYDITAEEVHDLRRTIADSFSLEN
jgi:hypothetical protein